MTALFNTRDALESSCNAAGRHARRIARQGQHTAADMGNEMRTLLAELEDTLTHGAQADAAELRDALKKRLNDAKARLEGAHDTFTTRAALAVSTADDYVRQNPWEIIAVVGGLALLTGWVLARSH